MGKFKQITDNIHETIYLSSLEKELISTPYFYRLHDVYQSSTVYLTFPSNRTKRYEHSLGTMELASQLFQSSLANAKMAVKKRFLERLFEQFVYIYSEFQNGTNFPNVFYLKDPNVQMILELRRTRTEKVDELKKEIQDIFKKSPQRIDGALSHFWIDFSSNEEHALENVYGFVYECALEAIRISSLFHDAGHPPYSHIIEDVLKEIYKECGSGTCTEYTIERVDGLRRSLGQFSKPFTYNQLLDEYHTDRRPETAKNELHESIGLKLLHFSFEWILPGILESIKKSEDLSHDEKIIRQLYYITIIEFSFAILMEKQYPNHERDKYSVLYMAIHKIIDGTLDADRLDYIMRDMTNSGVVWGRIPYRRIIEPARLTLLDENDLLDEKYKEKIVTSLLSLTQEK